jgi:hypothetical protein
MIFPSGAYRPRHPVNLPAPDLGVKVRRVDRHPQSSFGLTGDYFDFFGD